MMSWDNTTQISSIIKIGGTKDKLIPPINDNNTTFIKGGEHFMIVDKAHEVSVVINKSLNLYK